MRTALILAAALLAPPALAGPIQVERAWARPVAAGLSTSAAYMTLRNTGRTPQTLTGVSTPAARASVHESMNHGGMMMMHAMGPVVVPPSGAVEFKPGGLHVMLEGLKRPLKPGDRLPLTLTFKDGPPVRAEAQVRSTAP